MQLLPTELLENCDKEEDPWSSSKAIAKLRAKYKERTGGDFPEEIVKKEKKIEDELFLEYAFDFATDILENEEKEEAVIDSNEEMLYAEEVRPVPVPAEYLCLVEACLAASFPSARELRQHGRDCHPDLLCGKCGAVAACEADLLTHDCNKRHRCPNCFRQFTTRNELKTHSLIHTGEKPHQCDDCGKGFRQRATLDRHKAQSSK